MAYIEKRTNSKGEVAYRARVRQKGAPDLSHTFSTKKQAQKWAYKMEAEIRGGRYFGREEAQEKTFSEFICRYIDKELPRNPKAYKKQKMLLSWWNSHLGNFLLCHITPSMIAELRDKLMEEVTVKGRPRKGSTTNRYLSSLSRAYNVCIREWHWVKENPVTLISRPKESKPRDRVLSNDEINLLLDACKKSKSPHLYAVTLFGIGTGARYGEILGLKWIDVDFKRSLATFRNTKNGEDRTVFLSEQVLKCLKTESSKRVALSEFVFPSQKGKRPADITSAWKAVIKSLGFKDVCFHTLRHTAATILAEIGTPECKLKAITGHKSSAALINYIHTAASATATSLQRLNDEIHRKVG